MNLIPNYDLEIEKAVEAVEENEAERILLHMPDGIKPKSDKIVEHLEEEVDRDVDIMVWAGSAFGACDLPVEAENVGVDLLIHWGHSRWKVTKPEAMEEV